MPVNLPYRMEKTMQELMKQHYESNTMRSLIDSKMMIADIVVQNSHDPIVMQELADSIENGKWLLENGYFSYDVHEIDSMYNEVINQFWYRMSINTNDGTLV